MTSTDQPRPGQSPAATAPGAEVRPATSWVREHLDAVYRYARRRLSDAADAEDVAQESFLALLRARAEGRAIEDVGAWLHGTARRRIADLYRKKSRGHVPVALPVGWERFADEPLPEEALASTELTELVHVALGLLPSAARETLLAFHREGRSTAEIAKRLCVSPKAVEMRLRRARAAFEERFLQVGRDWLEEEGGEG